MEDNRNKEPAKDYYAGYYWGNQPYSSAEMPGKKSDEELQNDVNARLGDLGFSEVSVRVTNKAAILTGRVRNQTEKANAAAEAWKIPGIVKVSNSLQIQTPETAGPSSETE